MLTEIIPEIIDDAKTAGCENADQITGYLAAEISRLRSELRNIATAKPREWAERCAHLAVLMKNTGVGELSILRKPDGKYAFEITPEADAADDTCPKCDGIGYMPGVCSACNNTGKKSLWQMF